MRVTEYIHPVVGEPRYYYHFVVVVIVVGLVPSLQEKQK
jgi:hypothetical protein